MLLRLSARLGERFPSCIYMWCPGSHSLPKQPQVLRSYKADELAISEVVLTGDGEGVATRSEDLGSRGTVSCSD